MERSDSCTNWIYVHVTHNHILTCFTVEQETTAGAIALFALINTQQWMQSIEGLQMALLDVFWLKSHHSVFTICTCIRKMNMHYLIRVRIMMRWCIFINVIRSSVTPVFWCVSYCFCNISLQCIENKERSDNPFVHCWSIIINFWNSIWGLCVYMCAHFCGNSTVM